MSTHLHDLGTHWPKGTWICASVYMPSLIGHINIRGASRIRLLPFCCCVWLVWSARDKVHWAGGPICEQSINLLQIQSISGRISPSKHRRTKHIYHCDRILQFAWPSSILRWKITGYIHSVVYVFLIPQSRPDRVRDENRNAPRTIFVYVTPTHLEL